MCDDVVVFQFCFNCSFFDFCGCIKDFVIYVWVIVYMKDLIFVCIKFYKWSVQISFIYFRFVFYLDMIQLDVFVSCLSYFCWVVFCEVIFFLGNFLQVWVFFFDLVDLGYFEFWIKVRYFLFGVILSLILDYLVQVQFGVFLLFFCQNMWFGGGGGEFKNNSRI